MMQKKVSPNGETISQPQPQRMPLRPAEMQLLRRLTPKLIAPIDSRVSVMPPPSVSQLAI